MKYYADLIGACLLYLVLLVGCRGVQRSVAAKQKVTCLLETRDDVFAVYILNQ